VRARLAGWLVWYVGRPRREREGQKEGRKRGKKEGRKEGRDGWRINAGRKVGKVIYRKKNFPQILIL